MEAERGHILQKYFLYSDKELVQSLHKTTQWKNFFKYAHIENFFRWVNNINIWARACLKCMPIVNMIRLLYIPELPQKQKLF